MSDRKRIQDENPYAHIRQKSNDDWYLFWLCEDHEFIKDMGAFLKFHEDKFDLPYTDDIKKKSSAMVRSMKVKYNITDDEFDFIQTGLHSQMALDFPFEIMSETTNGKLVVGIPREIKKKDYVGAWSDLLDYLRPAHIPTSKRQTRNRSAADTKLIYAVHRARIKGQKFSEIFKQYQLGTLISYIGQPTNQFSSEDSLERYYRKYKPAR